MIGILSGGLSFFNKVYKMISTKSGVENNGFFNDIKNCSCDVCGKDNVSVVMHYKYNKPTLAECKTCNPQLFHAVSEAQKDAWLNGE